jgi:hypothetical protein
VRWVRVLGGLTAGAPGACVGTSCFAVLSHDRRESRTGSARRTWYGGNGGVYGQEPNESNGGEQGSSRE